MKYFMSLHLHISGTITEAVHIHDLKEETKDALKPACE